MSVHACSKKEGEADRPGVCFQKFPLAHDLPLPDYALPGCSGLDLRAALAQDVVIDPGKRALISTGLRMRIPERHEGQVRSRSGLATKHGVTVITGTIDASYRGEVFVLLANLGSEPFTVTHGQRIAQLVIAPVACVAVYEGEVSPEETIRGAGGFGSTGVL